MLLQVHGNLYLSLLLDPSEMAPLYLTPFSVLRLSPAPLTSLLYVGILYNEFVIIGFLHVSLTRL